MALVFCVVMSILVLKAMMLLQIDEMKKQQTEIQDADFDYMTLTQIVVPVEGPKHQPEVGMGKCLDKRASPLVHLHLEF